MAIKVNLVLDKNTANLSGFIDLGDTGINILDFEKNNDLTTHALVFFQGCYFRFKVQLRTFCY